MARSRHSYAIRLEVEGGNRVKADLRSVGESGEHSIKKIDRSADRASRGLGTLSDRASALRSRMRLSTLFNRPANDDPRCVEPISLN